MRISVYDATVLTMDTAVFILIPGDAGAGGRGVGWTLGGVTVLNILSAHGG